jgi:hypothetical protein
MKAPRRCLACERDLTGMGRQLYCSKACQWRAQRVRAKILAYINDDLGFPTDLVMRLLRPWQPGHSRPRT